MNRLLIAVFGCVVVYGAWAWTTAETNAVVRELVSVAALQLESEESIDGDCIIDPPDPVVTTYESLFATNRQAQLPYWNQWTPADRKTAFENFLAETSRGVSHEGISADRALLFCLERDFAGALIPARDMLLSTNVSADCRSVAASVYTKFATPTEERTRFVEAIITNKIVLVDDRARLLWKYGRNKEREVRSNLVLGLCEALERDYDAGMTNLVVQGASMLYRSVDEPYNAYHLDRLFLKVFPSYATSSNRLEVAMLGMRPGLRSGVVNDAGINIFSAITNQLLNAAQPLPVVDGL
jgi:hypothetical protein